MRVFLGLVAGFHKLAKNAIFVTSILLIIFEGVRVSNNVQQAGIFYNLGNLLLFGTPLLLAGDLSPLQSYVAAPLPVIAAILFFTSGFAYGANKFRTGNAFSVVAATILAADCFIRHDYFAAATMFFLHAGGKLIGTFPEFFSRHFAHASNPIARMSLGSPANAAGFGPMISRIPTAIDVFLSGNWLLGMACISWLVADWLLTKTKFKKS
jgi:hypothetical protein